MPTGRRLRLLQLGQLSFQRLLSELDSPELIFPGLSRRPQLGLGLRCRAGNKVLRPLLRRLLVALRVLDHSVDAVQGCARPLGARSLGGRAVFEFAGRLIGRGLGIGVGSERRHA